MTTYNWSIESISLESEGNYRVDWICHANDAPHSAVSLGTVHISSQEEISSVLTVESIQQILALIEEDIDRDEVESNLQVMIDSSKNKTPLNSVQFVKNEVVLPELPQQGE